uniref:GNAT family N-acetyltransferase n=1 Tax=Thaumasiovibrio occultus TaxID=1891184 RepID=UPI000B34E606|nr:GNAT family N-acetyltransferase [Thaumasiovibrio occultus]
MRQPTLHTDRLTLRPFELADANKVQSMAGEPCIANASPNIPYPYKPGMAGLWIGTHSALWQNTKAVHFAVVDRSNYQLTGCVSLQHIESGAAQLGYWIGRDFWGQGYASEAAKVAIEFGFSQLALDRIYAQHLSKDTQPGKVLKKIGLQFIEKRKDALRIEHLSQDVEYYQLTSNEYHQVTA